MLKTNIDAFLGREPKDPMRTIKMDMRKRVKRAATLMHEYVTTHTPVWEGTTLANFQWSTGSPYTGALVSPGGTSIPPGPTNQMKIGSEPRFAANKSIADSNFARLNFSDPFQSFHLTNLSEAMLNIEYGLPPQPGMRARAPSGVFRVGALVVETTLQSEGLL